MASNLSNVIDRVLLTVLFRRSTILCKYPTLQAQSPPEENASPKGESVAGYEKEETMLLSSHYVIKLCEFIKERWNIHQNIRAMILGVRLAYGKIQEERGVKVSGEIVSRQHK